MISDKKSEILAFSESEDIVNYDAEILNTGSDRKSFSYICEKFKYSETSHTLLRAVSQRVITQSAFEVFYGEFLKVFESLTVLEAMHHYKFFRYVEKLAKLYKQSYEADMKSRKDVILAKSKLTMGEDLFMKGWLFGSRDFLKRFDFGGVQSTIATWFLNMAGKHPKESPLFLILVIEAEREEVLNLKRREVAYLEKSRLLLDKIQEFPYEAISYAEWVISYLKLPNDTREQLRAFQKKEIELQVPPTPKQLAYLAQLGFKGEVNSLKEAQMLISKLKGKTDVSEDMDICVNIDPNQEKKNSNVFARHFGSDALKVFVNFDGKPKLFDPTGMHPTRVHELLMGGMPLWKVLVTLFSHDILELRADASRSGFNYFDEHHAILRYFSTICPDLVRENEEAHYPPDIFLYFCLCYASNSYWGGTLIFDFMSSKIDS